MASKSPVEDLMLDQIQKAKLPEPEREFKFWPGRRFRFDFAWEKEMIALEVEGGTWSGGRHLHPIGFERDCEKYNEAAIRGWTVIRVTSSMVKDKRALEIIKKALKQ